MRVSLFYKAHQKVTVTPEHGLTQILVHAQSLLNLRNLDTPSEGVNQRSEPR
jgi:hypothetical protein